MNMFYSMPQAIFQQLFLNISAPLNEYSILKTPSLSVETCRFPVDFFKKGIARYSLEHYKIQMWIYFIASLKLYSSGYSSTYELYWMNILFKKHHPSLSRYVDFPADFQTYWSFRYSLESYKIYMWTYV